MAKKPAGSPDLVFSGLFNFAELYKTMHFWLAENGWQDQNGGGEDQHEVLMHEKHMAGGPMEHWIWWRMKKPVNSYFHYEMSIDFHTIAISKTQEVVDGKQIKAWNGELNLFLKTFVVYNKEGFEKGKITSFFSNVFENRLYKKQIEEQQMIAYRETYDFQAAIKKFLKMAQYVPDAAREPFHPSIRY